MSTKHTPGPWTIERYTNYIGYSVYAADGRGCIAERWYDTAREAPYGDEIGANAKLIAASPELLNALQILAGRCRRYLDEQEGGQEYLDLANAAITKATGEPAP